MRLEKTGRGTMVVVPETLATERPGIFAAGDCVTGPLNVVDAVAAGRRAAVAMVVICVATPVRQGLS